MGERLTEPLSPERVDEIRAYCADPEVPLVGNKDDVLALCDTADAYWGLKAELGRVLGDLSRQLIEANEGRAAAERELETLGGIVARTNDGWGYVLPDAEGDKRIWWRLQDGAGEFVSGPDGLQQEPMTPAEVEAIYGREEDGDDRT